jgi:linoleoyl-CoA desaturase
VVPVLFFKVSIGLALGAWFLQVIAASIFALFVLLPLHPLPDNAFPKLDKRTDFRSAGFIISLKSPMI